VGDKPRAHTVEEMRAMFITQMQSLATYWAKTDLNRPEFKPLIERDGETLYRIEGFMHSVLVMLDGGGALPAFDVTPSPHESDEAFHRANGENWWAREVINDCQLHDEWNAMRRK